MKIQITPDHSDLRQFDTILYEVAGWIAEELALEVSEVDIILTDDRTLRKMHSEYLGDNTFTDVMTFDLSDTEAIEAEIYISSDRVRQHASRFKTTMRNELMRMVIHAFLHLAGYDDQTESKRKIMKEKEDQFLLAAEKVFPINKMVSSNKKA